MSRYDYSKVNYVNSITKVTIICPEHGEFQQRPNDHLQGKGCPKCGGSVNLTTNEFIKKAKEMHGDRYNYSLVDYINSQTKVTIICPEHGEFKQTPSKHLSGQGCIRCSKITNIDDFIKKSNIVHDEKYDYSLVKYINSQTKVTIICPEHGEFKQTPSSHLSGHGCSVCSGIVKYSTKKFIKKAIEVHDDKYDYSLVNYVNSQTKVSIICPEHGEFKIRPLRFLDGFDCQKCSKIKQSKKRALTRNEFIKKAKEMHGDRYNYSLVDYINNHTKVTIICPEHGEFEQTPSNHLKGKNCGKCFGRGATTNSFIKKAKNKHGDKYDYSLVNYVGTDIKVTIICPEHGEFEQTPYKHLKGQGCPKYREHK